MPNMQHVYLTAHGSYPSGAWLGEAAQIGVRVAFAPTLQAPDKGAIWTPTPGGEIQADYGTATGTHGTLSKTWKARIGETGSAENMDAAAQIDMAEDFWTFLNALKINNHSSFQWTHVKIAAVTAEGKTPVVASIYTFTAPLVGGGTNALPPQVAMAISSRANLVGRRGRGRVYFPALQNNLCNPDGTVSAATQTATKTAFKTLIDNLQSTPGLSVMQPFYFIGSADSPTVVRPIEVRTGSRLDTIQSRRRQVAEVYSTLAL